MILKTERLIFSITENNGSWHIVGGSEGQGGVISGDLTPFPGSDQLMVSHNLWIYPAARGKGYSKEYNEMIATICKEWLYRAIVATVNVNNTIQLSRLRSLGWERLSKTLWMLRLNSE